MDARIRIGWGVVMVAFRFAHPLQSRPSGRRKLQPTSPPCVRFLAQTDLRASMGLIGLRPACREILGHKMARVVPTTADRSPASPRNVHRCGDKEKIQVSAPLEPLPKQRVPASCIDHSIHSPRPPGSCGSQQASPEALSREFQAWAADNDRRRHSLGPDSLELG